MARKSKRRRRPRRLWPWLGLGALGLLATFLGRRREVPRPSRPSPPPTTPPGELEADVAISWVPGPSGSLRVAELHPRAPLALVFVHGLGGRLEQWSGVLAGLGPGLRAVAVDLPGHGGSDPAAGDDYGVVALQAAIGAVADSLSLRRFVLVAHSLGASVALEYAARHPGRVSGVLMVDPNGDQTRLPEADREAFLGPLRRDPRAEFEGYFRQILVGSSPGVAEEVLRSLDDTPAEALLGALEGVAAYSPLPALERYGGPVVSITSELNATSISLHRLHPGLPARPVPEAGHWLMMDRADEVLEVLWDFLDDVKSG